MIHPLAHVSPDAIIGPRTRVWQFASVIRGAVLGADCNIATGACIDGSRLGDGCIIGHNVAMGPGFLLKDRVFIGPQCTLANDAWPRAVKSGFDVGRFGPERHAIIIEDDASIGAGSTILPGVWIGQRAMIAAGSVVTRDVPADHLWKDRRSEPIANEAAHLANRMRFVRVPSYQC